MAQRARARAEHRKACVRAEEDRLRERARQVVRQLPGDLSYLNGLPVMGDSTHVLDGTSVRCMGCGYSFGVTCVALTGVSAAVPEPVWPFPVWSCRVEDHTETLIFDAKHRVSEAVWVFD